MRNTFVVSLLFAILASAGCLPKGNNDESWDDEPRAGRDQCDYAAVHVKGLNVGAPLDDDQTAAWRQDAEYAQFMDECQRYSSMSVQCLIDAPTLDDVANCQ